MSYRDCPKCKCYHDGDECRPFCGAEQSESYLHNYLTIEAVTTDKKLTLGIKSCDRCDRAVIVMERAEYNRGYHDGERRVIVLNPGRLAP